MQSASKVGLLVVVFVGLLFGAYAVLGSSMFAPKTTTYYAYFSDVTGVTEGAKVLIAGVKVGSVTKVELISARSARLKLAILADTKIPAGSTATIAGSLIGIGDNPVQIMPPEKDTGRYLSAGGRITGVKLSALDGLLPDSKATLAKVDEALGHVNKLMSEMQENKLMNGLKGLLTTSEQTMSRFGELAATTNTLMAQNKSTIARALRDADAAVNDVRKAIQLATKLVGDDKLKGKMAGLLDQLNATTGKAEQLVVSLNEFVNDPKLREPLNASMANMEKMTDSGTRIAASAEEMARNGAVVSQKAIELAEKASLIADDARETLRKLQGFFQKVPSSSVLNNIETRMDVLRETEPGRFRTDLDVKVPFKDFDLHFGVFDAFETNKLNVQLGQKFGTYGEYRYGIYAGKPAVGVDFRLAPDLHLEGNAFGLNETRLDLRARYDFGKNFVGWLGINRVFDGNAPMIGIGFRK
jgi:phospholipid/cholesterol/gamma-HCH transport system substrate-binding protein